MRKIVTAVTAAALSLSMLASAVPALAVAGYDSAYAGESAFVNISPGQTQNFQVFFANTGQTTWSRGTSTQVDLAACLADKVTCNAQDASEASWNSAWLSSTRYATTVQTTTAPGSLGTFSYNITAPVGAASGTYRFNGDLVLSTTGEKIHPEGYFQDATIGGPGTGAATITDLEPNEGSTTGDDDIVITGTGIVCTPAFPSVSFGGTNAVVVSCGSTSVTATSPAHAEGDVTVTLTNSGSAASNGLIFGYIDDTDPVFTSMTVSGDLLTVTFSEPVCSDTGGTEADWNVLNISSPSGDLAAGASYGTNVPDCADDEASTTVIITLNTTVANGALVEATLNQVPGLSGENVNYEDEAGNAADASQARQATATAPETTQPDLASVTGNVGSTTITLTFSEPIFCDAGFTPATEITVNNLDGADPTVTGFGSDPCTIVRADAETTFNILISDAIEADSDYRVTITSPTEVQDAFNNNLDDATADFRGGAGDFTPPTITDARRTASAGSSDFSDVSDAFILTFSEVMDDVTTGDTIQIQDEDGTELTLNCGVDVTCDWNAAATAITVTVTTDLTGQLPADGDAGSGTTHGMAGQFFIRAFSGFADPQGNPPLITGDTFVNFE